METPSYANAFPSRAQLQHWGTDLAEAVDDRQVDAAALVELLALLRRLGRDAGWLADVVLLLAREQGAALPGLARAWSRTGQSTYTHAPDARIHKLVDGYGSAAGVLQAYLALPSSPAFR
ncbi:hypothetical protein [Bounagaea algeriensis]